MRTIVASVVVLVAGCASIQDLTYLSCDPPLGPNDVTLKREAYLYQIDGESKISLWDSRYRYGQGLDESKHLIIHTPPPLYTLAAGTRLTITKVTRETQFDNPPNVIHVKGVAHVGAVDVPFLYTWGINNHVDYAPWESNIYNPRDFSRTMQCKT